MIQHTDRPYKKRDKKKEKAAKKKFFRPKPCSFCLEKIDRIDYKDAQRLKKFITEKGKILPNRITGACSFHQRSLSVAIKRARFMALLPYM